MCTPQEKAWCMFWFKEIKLQTHKFRETFKLSGHPISNVILLEDFKEIKNTHKILI